MRPPFLLGYGTNGLAEHPLPAALGLLDDAGYDAVALTLGFPHLDPLSAPPAAVRATGARLASMREGRGAAVVVETGTRYLLDPARKHHPTLVDRDARARMRYLTRAVDVAAELGARCVSFFSGVLPAGDRAAEGRARLLGRLPVLLEHAAARGTTLALEPEPGMLVETVEDGLRVLRVLGDPPGLGLTVDVGHCLVVEPGGVEGALRAAAPVLRNVQLEDMPRTHHEHRPFGDGDLDLPATLATLAEIGYAGVAAVELPRHSHAAPDLVAASMAALTRAWKEASG